MKIDYKGEDFVDLVDYSVCNSANKHPPDLNQRDNLVSEAYADPPTEPIRQVVL
jgi:hypothetical protein